MEKNLQQELADDRQNNTGREPERLPEWGPETHQAQIARERREANAARARRLLGQ